VQHASPKLRRNHPSLKNHAAQGHGEFKRLKVKGEITWLGTKRPARLNVNPCALIITEKEDGSLKSRLILDLLKGQVNKRVRTMSVNYGTVEQAVAKMRRGSWLFVVDLEDCFWHWKVSEKDSWELGFFDEHSGQFGKCDYCPNGLSPAPGINDQSLKEILRVMGDKLGFSVVDFVDDMLGEGADENLAWARIEAVVAFFSAIGLQISQKPSGIRAPSQVQTWCGWIFDSLRLTVASTEKKLKKALDRTASVLVKDGNRSLMARELAECGGILNHLAEVDISLGRLLHPIWADLNASQVYQLWQSHPNADVKVSLSERSRQNLQRWWTNSVVPPHRPLLMTFGTLTSWKPRSVDFVEAEALVRKGEVLVYESDASSLHGWSYVCCKDSRIVSGIWSDEQQGHSINWKELWTVVEMVRREGSHWQGWRVLVRCDNKAAVHYVNIRYGSVLELEKLAVILDRFEQESGGLILAKHLPGVANVVADAGSRSSTFGTDWASDRCRHACLRPKPFAQINAELGPFDVDLFADRKGITALAPVWFCPEDTAFAVQLQGEICWAHPPRVLIQRFLDHVMAQKKVASQQIKVAVLVPCDSGAPWFKKKYLAQWKRRQAWPAGSDLFRQVVDDDCGEGVPGQWRKFGKTDLPYVVLPSW
jgi:hypothetical protein